MTTVGPSESSGIAKRRVYSCIRCADRKVKCDRQTPCSNCNKHGVDCVHVPSDLTLKRKKRIKVQILNDRLKYYETLLQEQGIDPTKLPGTTVSDPNQSGTRSPKELLQSPTPDSGESTNKAGSVSGNGRFDFVENALWTRVVQESRGPESILEDSDDVSDMEGDFSFVLHVSYPLSGLKQIAS